MFTRPRTLYGDTEENPRKASGGELCLRLTQPRNPPGPSQAWPRLLQATSGRGKLGNSKYPTFLGEKVFQNKLWLFVFSMELPPRREEPQG